ncbi:regulatory protein RecX [Leucobacter komagatae]|uniref:regulatory protein RecX n=1 Tax=Leucobacter komagatae TaxID=55969 RepID=UPI000696EA71|nr:regulatory protein RecX [Leucobacter komagatae]
MAVRFLPPPEERPKPQREERGDLAEVIEFRSKLRRPAPASAWAAEPAPANSEGGDAGSSDEPGSWAPAPEAADERPEAEATGKEPAAGAAGAQRSWARLIEVPFGAPRAARPSSAEAPATASPWANDLEGAQAGEPHAAAVEDELIDDGPTAYETAVKLLARRALSSGELQRALIAAGHPEIDAEEAVARCEESLYLDDDDLATTVATKLRESKGESKARIRQKLRERHLPDTAIEAALDGLDDEAELELLTQTAVDRARRMTGLDRQTAERRLLGFLARRGWSGERATRAAREALDGTTGGARGGRGTVRFN